MKKLAKLNMVNLGFFFPLIHDDVCIREYLSHEITYVHNRNLLSKRRLKVGRSENIINVSFGLDGRFEQAQKQECFRNLNFIYYVYAFFMQNSRQSYFVLWNALRYKKYSEHSVTRSNKYIFFKYLYEKYQNFTFVYYCKLYISFSPNNQAYTVSTSKKFTIKNDNSLVSFYFDEDEADINICPRT